MIWTVVPSSVEVQGGRGNGVIGENQSVALLTVKRLRRVRRTRSYCDDAMVPNQSES